MSEAQLREAYALHKQGQKNEAMTLVQAVLRDDKRNINAWWLLAALLDDDDKIVKALENILALNPEHLGARKKLAYLRPEYAHLYDEASAKRKTSEKPDDYWERAENPTKVRQRRNNREYVAPTILAAVLITGAVIAFTMMSYMFELADYDAPSNNEYHATILADMPDTPEAVIQAFFEAYYRQSTETLYALSCPAYYSEIDRMAQSFDDPLAWQISVDFSQTRFELDSASASNNYAYVSLHGVATIQNGATTVESNWDEIAAAEGYDTLGYLLSKINGQWLVCQ